MSRSLAALALSAAAAAQAVEVPDAVRFGAPFEVVVTAERPFDPASLLPLEVEVLERQADGGRERLRLQARCYELGEVTLPLDPPQVLAVTTSLPDPPGELEWPRDGYELAAPAVSRWWVAGVTALSIVALYAGWLWAARRRARAATPTHAATASWSAAAALRALEAAADDEAFFTGLKAIVRRHCAERFALPAEVRTSEELLGALPRARERLSPCLADCDLVLFGPLPAASTARERTRSSALAFVLATEGAP